MAARLLVHGDPPQVDVFEIRFLHALLQGAEESIFCAESAVSHLVLIPGAAQIHLLAAALEGLCICLDLLYGAGVNVVEFAEEEASLEDLYLEVVRGGAD